MSLHVWAAPSPDRYLSPPALGPADWSSQDKDTPPDWRFPTTGSRNSTRHSLSCNDLQKPIAEQDTVRDQSQSRTQSLGTVALRASGVCQVFVRCYHSWGPQVRSIWLESVSVQMKNKLRRLPDDSSQNHWSSTHCPPPPDSSSPPGPWETDRWRQTDRLVLTLWPEAVNMRH